MSEEERRIESDMLLVNAYHAMSAAAQDIAFWATQTAEALEKKVVASRREVGAAAATLRAQEGYEEAMARIGQAMAHRAGGGLATSANGASD